MKSSLDKTAEDRGQHLATVFLRFERDKAPVTDVLDELNDIFATRTIGQAQEIFDITFTEISYVDTEKSQYFWGFLLDYLTRDVYLSGKTSSLFVIPVAVNLNTGVRIFKDSGEAIKNRIAGAFAIINDIDFDVVIDKSKLYDLPEVLNITKRIDKCVDLFNLFNGEDRLPPKAKTSAKKSEKEKAVVFGLKYILGVVVHDDFFNLSVYDLDESDFAFPGDDPALQALLAEQRYLKVVELLANYCVTDYRLSDDFILAEPLSLDMAMSGGVEFINMFGLMLELAALARGGCTSYRAEYQVHQAESELLDYIIVTLVNNANSKLLVQYRWFLVDFNEDFVKSEINAIGDLIKNYQVDGLTLDA